METLLQLVWASLGVVPTLSFLIIMVVVIMRSSISSDANIKDKKTKLHITFIWYQYIPDLLPRDGLNSNVAVALR
jgi:hypothetical protein